MAQSLEWLEIGIDDVSAHAVASSFMDLIAAYEAAGRPSTEQLAGLLRERAMARCDLGDVIVGERVDDAALGATVLEGLKFDPCDAYVVLFAAIARHANANTVRICHGWPRLTCT